MRTHRPFCIIYIYIKSPAKIDGSLCKTAHIKNKTRTNKEKEDEKNKNMRECGKNNRRWSLTDSPIIVLYHIFVCFCWSPISITNDITLIRTFSISISTFYTYGSFTNLSNNIQSLCLAFSLQHTTLLNSLRLSFAFDTAIMNPKISRFILIFKAQT